MRIKILFFATLRDYVGIKALELEFPADTTVAGLKDIVERYPKMIPAQKFHYGGHQPRICCR